MQQLSVSKRCATAQPDATRPVDRDVDRDGSDGEPPTAMACHAWSCGMNHAMHTMVMSHDDESFKGSRKVKGQG